MTHESLQMLSKISVGLSRFCERALLESHSAIRSADVNSGKSYSLVKRDEGERGASVELRMTFPHHTRLSLALREGLGGEGSVQCDWWALSGTPWQNLLAIRV